MEERGLKSAPKRFSQNEGWFGQAARPAETDAIWKAAGTANANVARLNLTSSSGAGRLLPPPQIAVFFDELAPKVMPLDSRDRLVRRSGGGNGSPSARQQTAAGAWMLAASSRELAIIGAPTRHYYLADLGSLVGTREFSHVKLLVFLNAFAPSDAVRRTMREHFNILKNTTNQNTERQKKNIAADGVSLLFLGPAGLVAANEASHCTRKSQSQLHVRAHGHGAGSGGILLRDGTD